MPYSVGQALHCYAAKPPTMFVQQTLAELVAIDSVSSRSNAPIISYLKDRCERLGFQTQQFPHVDENGTQKINLVASNAPSLHSGGAAQMELALVGHTDTVPFDPNWKEALTLTEHDEKLSGRGACDTKAFIAAALTAVEPI